MIIYKLSEKDWWPREGGGWLKCTERLTCVILVTIFVPTYWNKVLFSIPGEGGKFMYLPLGCIPPGKNWKVLGPKRFSEFATDFLKLCTFAKLGLISQELRTRYVYYFAVWMTTSSWQDCAKPGKMLCYSTLTSTFQLDCCK